MAARTGIKHRNPVDAINVRYFREVAIAKRKFPHMMMLRADYIMKARRKRREALAKHGIRVR